MKLMFIDDERNVVLGLQRIVDWRQYGFKVIGVAANGQEGLTKIQARTSSFWTSACRA